MKLSTQPYKGTRDFYPEDMRFRNWIFDKMRKVCESYGYEEYDAPVLEPLELYASKTSEEVVNEQSYKFTDRGDREVIMRPEMTPSISRMVAGRRQELPYPQRLYSIANFFRYERPQKGRLREFWQLNADIFGAEGVDADIEIIMLADAIMKEFGAKREMYEIRVNSRKLLNKRIDAVGLLGDRAEVIRIIDKYDKQEKEDIAKQLSEKVENPDELLSFLEKDGPSEEVNQLVKQVRTTGIDNVVPVETLARGFDYYTDFIFEVFDTNPDNNRSMFGGGRYDGLVGNFGVEPLPTVGFAMGDVTLANFLKSNNLMPDLNSAADLVIIGIDADGGKLQEIAGELRQKELNVAVDFTDRKLDKKIKSAVKLGARYGLFVGADELSKDEFNLKNLQTEKEEKTTLENIPSIINKS